MVLSNCRVKKREIWAASLTCLEQSIKEYSLDIYTSRVVYLLKKLNDKLGKVWLMNLIRSWWGSQTLFMFSKIVFFSENTKTKLKYSSWKNICSVENLIYKLVCCGNIKIQLASHYCLAHRKIGKNKRS